MERYKKVNVKTQKSFQISSHLKLRNHLVLRWKCNLMLMHFGQFCSNIFNSIAVKCSLMFAPLLTHCMSWLLCTKPTHVPKHIHYYDYIQMSQHVGLWNWQTEGSLFFKFDKPGKNRLDLVANNNKKVLNA